MSRFARYMLTFELTDAAGAARYLRAQTRALFSGARGQARRALVIGTRAHTAATTHILRSVRRLGLALAPAGLRVAVRRTLAFPTPGSASVPN